jgi:hypothetical protein
VKRAALAAAILGAVMPVDEQPRDEAETGAQDRPKTGGLFDGGVREMPPRQGDPLREHDELIVELLSARRLSRRYGDVWFEGSG